MELITLIALGWLSNLLVKFWLNLTGSTKHLYKLKPFSCEPCMGFWIGLLYFFLKDYSFENMIIFAAITSLMATLLSKLNDLRRI